MWINFVKTYPILSAMLQFAVLGTIGEFFGTTIRSGKFKGRCPDGRSGT